MIEHHGYKWEVRHPSNIDDELANGRDWEPVVTEWIESQLEPGDYALDVGANIGWFTVLMSGWVGPAGRVMAIEPEPTFRRRLAEHLEVNGLTNVSVYPWAVSDYIGAAWCIKNPGPYFASARTMRESPGTIPEPATEVQCTTVDEMWPFHRLDLIKIDVDGWERQVLLGAQNTIQKFWPRIAIEIADTETAALLISWGYTLAWERGHKLMTIGEIGATLSPGTPTINMFAWKE